MATDSLIIGPALALGLLIGIYEAIVIHRDVQIPQRRFMHSLHAIFLSLIFVFCSMNAPFVLKLLPFLTKIPVIGTAIGLQVIIGLIAAVKIHTVSRVLKNMSGAGDGETWFHSILIGALIAAAPYVYLLIKPLLPNWLLF